MFHFLTCFDEQFKKKFLFVNKFFLLFSICIFVINLFTNYIKKVTVILVKETPGN